MKAGFRIIDADMHLMEPFDLWERNLAEPYHSLTRVSAGPAGYFEASAVQFELAGQTLDISFQALSRRHSLRRVPANPLLAKVRTQCIPEIFVEGLDVEGIDVGILVPTLLSLMTTCDGLDPEHALALCRVYNDWASAFSRSRPERFQWWGWLPRQDAKLAAQEAQRCVEELGAIGVAITSGAVDGHLLSDPFFEPLWQEVSHLRVPLGIHVFAADRLADDVVVRYRGHPRAEITAFACGTILHSLTSVAELILGGVLERYPNIRPVIMENGASWVPWLLWRLDSMWENYSPDVDYRLAMKPSDYFRRQCYVAIDCDEQPITHLIADGLAGNLLMSTDYPHAEGPFPEAINSFLALTGISDESRQKILWDNAARLFGLGAVRESTIATLAGDPADRKGLDPSHRPVYSPQQGGFPCALTAGWSGVYWRAR